MTLDYVTRNYAHFTAIPKRKIAGVVLHHTATTYDIDTTQSLGGWHWLVGKQALYRDVPESSAAWHDARTDRWRPPWVTNTPPKYQPLSDINSCSIGIEIAYAPQDEELPSAIQYARLRALLQDIYYRRGQLPIVGHGETDSTRWPTEPHGLDWTRLGCGPRGAQGRYLLIPPPEVPDVSILTNDEAIAAAQQLWNTRGVPFNSDTALAKAWLAEWQAGRFRGLPSTGELAVVPGEIAVQGFDQGAGTWKNGQPVSWDA